MPHTLSFVFHVIIFTLLANPVWADCEAYRNLDSSFKWKWNAIARVIGEPCGLPHSRVRPT
jgi:hypothetical protein